MALSKRLSVRIEGNEEVLIRKIELLSENRKKNFL